LTKEGRKVLVTGGAGFIGSHLVDSLMNRGTKVVVLDNLNSGKLENLNKWHSHERFEFQRGDTLNQNDIKNAINGCTVVFHLAANPDVRVGNVDTKVDYEQNIMATYNLLEAMRKSTSCKNIIFTSSSTVYGEAKVTPTPEGYGPLKPISLYGASKLACESLISGYAHMFGIKSVICRLANIIGSRSSHGAIYDFVKKLEVNPEKLGILGDGTQNKSYLYIDDCIEACLIAAEKTQEVVEIYNVGSEDKVDVLTIAKIVTKEMGLGEVEIYRAGGSDNGRGWKGDVKEMFLDISKLKKLGWKPKYSSAEAVRLAIRDLLSELEKGK
jgi:UDP-glucose 4-epimerase